MPTTPLDQDAINLAKAIKMQESGNDPAVVDGSKKGKLGETYAYQWMPGMYDSESKQYFGSVLPPTPENQNKVAYAKIKALKDEGKSPSEIAAIWNGAHKDANGTYIANNPDYVSSVQKFYNQFKTGSQGQVLGASNANQIASPVAPQDAAKPTDGDMLAPPTEPAPFTPEAETPAPANPFVNPQQDILSGNSQNNVERTKGAAKGILSTLQGGDILHKMNEMAGKTTDFTGMTDAQRAAVVAPKNASQQAGSVESQIGASVLPIGEGRAAASATKGLIGEALTGAKDDVLQAVSPRLTPKIAAETKTTTQGLLKKIVPVATKQLQKVADAVRPYYEAGATWSKNAENAENALADEARTLGARIDAVDHPVVIKELGARLSKAPEPISLRGTPFAKQIMPLKKAAVDLTRKAGGTVRGTFQALRQFDDYVEKTWPTLWDNENAPMRNAVTAIRNEWKDFIEENLPADAVYKDSLNKQSLLYDARDVFREKAALGEKQSAGEIGTTGPQRWAVNHPKTMGALKSGASLVGSGLGLGAGYGAYQGIFGPKQ